MSLPRPVPSKAALNALRGILFTTSCSVVLLAEERRQRTKIARAAVDNARKLHTVKARRNSVPLVDARAPDGDWHVVDLNNLPRRRKRRKESSIERSKSASPRIDDQSKPSRAASDLADCDGTSRARSNDWPLDAKSRADLRDAESARTKQQRHSRVGSDEFRLLDASTWRPIAPHAKLTDKGDNNAKLHGYAEALSQSSGSFAHLRSSVDPLASVAESACYPEIDWASPEWGSQEEMTAFYDEGVEALEPSDVEWGLPYWTRGSRNSKFATPEDRRSPSGNERLLPPSTYDELWTSQDSASNEYRRTQSRLYRSLREIQTTASDDISQEHADLIIRAKMYLLYSPRDEEGRTEFFRRLTAPGSMVRSFNGAKASARKLLEDLWRAAKDTDPDRKIASHYLNLAIEVLRSFPGVEHRMAGSSHPAGLGVTKRLIQLATVRDHQALGEIFDIILPNCVDTTGFIAKLFQFLHSRNDGVDSLRCLLQHFSSQPSHRYGFVCDEAFLQEVLRKHGRMLGQPEATQKVYAAVREANSTGFMDISRNVDFDIHLLLLEGAMVHNAPCMISSELRELEDIDGKRFAEDPFFRNAAILDTILNATPENFESVVEWIEELRTSDSEVFSRALTHVVNMCQQRLPPERFLEITWMLIGRHELPIEDQWAHFGLEHYLSASKPDFYALHSWLQHCKESGWSPSDDTMAYVDWHLGLYGDVTPNMSTIDNVLEVADQCASREERRQEAKLMRGYTFHLSPQEEQPVSVEMDRQVAAFEMQRLELRQHVFWRNIRAMRALEPWEKRWLMNAARACLNEEMSDEHKRRFDIMWNHINKSIFKAAWSVFARNYKPCQCPLPILRLAVMARLRIDGDDLSITEQLIDEVHAQGQNVDDLLEPLLRAQLDRDRPDKPGPTSVIAQALQKGHKISDQVYNYAARAAFKTRNSQGAIAICKLAATHNGDGNLIYCVENFSNLMRGYVTILGFRELSSLLYTLVEQNPSYTGTRVFRDAFRSAMKVMASRAVAKEEKCSRTVAAKCRQFLEFMVKVRSELVYDAHRISRPEFVVQADKLRRDKYMSTADRRKHFSQILSPISEQQIADLAVDSPRQTWLWSPSDPSAVDAPDDDVSSKPHEQIGTSPETDNGRPADSALNAVMSWGLEEASPQMAEESLNRAGGAATPGRHAASSNPLASHGANAGVAFDRVFIGPSTSFRSDIKVSSIEGQTAMGRQHLQHSATASFLRQWADEGAVDKRGGQGRARSASNGNLLRPADRFALKPNVSRKAWGWDESKHRPTPFDKIAAARRTDRPAEHIESTW